MFVKSIFGELVNVLLAQNIGASEYPVGSQPFSVTADFADLQQIILYAGIKEECQAYMAELEKELAAFGKLVRIEVD